MRKVAGLNFPATPSAVAAGRSYFMGRSCTPSICRSSMRCCNFLFAQPDYRCGRSHAEFVQNIPARVEDLKRGLQQAWPRWTSSIKFFTRAFTHWCRAATRRMTGTCAVEMKLIVS